jgi:hypothetical protein
MIAILFVLAWFVICITLFFLDMVMFRLTPWTLILSLPISAVALAYLWVITWGFE